MLVSSSAIAQLISFLATPFLTRLYNPADFGLYAIYVSILSFLIVISNARYELAIIIPKSSREAYHLLVISLAICGTLTILLSIAIFFISYLNITKVLFAFYLIPLTVLTSGVSQALNYWFIREKEYIVLGKNRVKQSIIANTVNLGFSPLGVTGLVLGEIVGQVVFHTELLIESYQKRFKIYASRLLAVAKKYRSYPFKSAPAALLNTISNQGEYVIYALFFDSGSLGYYYLANRLITASKILLRRAIWQAFLGESCRKDLEQLSKTLMVYQCKILRLTTLGIYSFLFIVSHLVIKIFGPQWSNSICFFYPVIISAHFNFVVTSFELFIPINRPGAELKFNTLLACSKISAIIFTSYIGGNLFTVVVCSAVIQSIMFIGLGCWSYGVLGESYYLFIKLYGRELIRIAPYLLIIWYVSSLGLNFIFVMIIVIACYTVHLILTVSR